MSGAIILTGATGGVGRAVVRRLTGRGRSVAMLGRDPERILDSLDSLGVDPAVHMTAHLLDATDPGGVAAAVDEAAGEHDGISGLIDTAAIYEAGPATGSDAAITLKLLTVDLVTPLLLARAVAARFTAGMPGRIVHTTSMTAFVSRGDYAGYEVSKAGLVAASRSLAMELAADGHAVNTVAPGWIRTPMAAPFLDAVDAERIASVIPAARAAEPDEIAQVLVWLALDSPTFLTAQTIVVDGGQSLLAHQLGPGASAPSDTIMTRL